MSNLIHDEYGNIYVTGYEILLGTYGYCTVKYSAAGNKEWQSRVSTPPGYAAEGTNVAVDGCNAPYVIGHLPNTGSNNNYGIINYDAINGDTLWLVWYDSLGNNDNGHFIQIDQSGCVYVAGQSAFDDIVTIKYLLFV